MSRATRTEPTLRCGRGCSRGAIRKPFFLPPPATCAPVGIRGNCRGHIGPRLVQPPYSRRRPRRIRASKAAAGGLAVNRRACVSVRIGASSPRSRTKAAKASVVR